MKRIEFIAPVESMRGNLSGNQSLEYAVDNNPAYDAPDGVQYARNYQPRFIGAKRGSDGLKYFTVRTKTATNLKPTTRRSMAIVGVTAAIRSALMSAHAADYTKMQQAFDYLKAKGQLPEGQDTFKKWFDANVKQMLVYKKETWTFTAASISFTLKNPYDLGITDALLIKQSVWVKFANLFAFKSASASNVGYISIDGKSIFIASADDESFTFPNVSTYSNNPSYKANFAGVVVGGESVTYNTQPIYTMQGVLVTPGTVMTDGEKLTTAAPVE